ncbi:storkhead-box protein 1 [Daktulosphaira vitifoliae]|uniref:storkhead-box protein 1 n=1 Tax=Daktulosphaira vitifoliae TaxID=58002 RepID=UPI0021A9C26C|nr:storkhead-box protein 1 [Daktulosphaira vitifoliae]
MNSRKSIAKNSPVVGCRCHYILKRCLAIHLQKQSLVKYVPQQTEASPYWMYDNGYLIFQSFLESNLKCVWNRSLVEAMQVAKYEGYVSPGVLLLTSDPCSMEVIRGAWCRNVLRPPNSYVITKVGDVEDCVVEDLNQGQFTPLSEALCLVILELTSANQNATIDTIRSALSIFFSNIQPPSEQIIYDAMVNLMSDNKVYQTSKGYFVVTPEVQRLVGSTTASPVHSIRLDNGSRYCSPSRKGFLMSAEEAYVKVHGDIETIRDGDQTHQNIQTNLADIISGGNLNDKKLSPRNTRKLERRNSLKGSSTSRRLANTLQRSGSMRLISNKHKTEDNGTSGILESRKSPGIFSRLFGSRRSNSKTRKSNCCATQFPPEEWFNKSAQPQQTISTQTDQDQRCGETKKQQWPDRLTRSATLPRKVRCDASAVTTTCSVAGSSIVIADKTAAKKYPSSGSSGYNSLPRINGRKSAGANAKRSPSSELSFEKPPSSGKNVDKPDTPEQTATSNFDSSYSCDEISVNHSSSITVATAPPTPHKTAADLRREYFRSMSKYSSSGRTFGNNDAQEHRLYRGGSLRERKAIATNLNKYFDNACKIRT